MGPADVGSKMCNQIRSGYADDDRGENGDPHRGHRIAAAALDVLTEEPMSADCPLQGLDNCIITSNWLNGIYKN